MKVVNGRLHEKPTRSPDFHKNVNGTLISAYFGMYSVEVFQEKDGQMQRLQLSKDRWEAFKRMMHPNE